MFPAIKSLLLADPAVSALVGEHVYPDQVPEGKSVPAISLFVVSTRYQHLTDGTKLPITTSWQLNCLANTRMDASGLADAVCKALDNKSSSDIKNTLIINRHDEQPAAGVRLRRTILDVEIKHY